MRLSAEEKAEIVELVIHSPESVNKSLQALGIHKRTFYNWYKSYSEEGIDGLRPKARSIQQWNRIPDKERELVIKLALEYPHLSSRMLAVKMTDEQGIYISESSVYRILKSRGLIEPTCHEFICASNKFTKQTLFVNEMWQTDFTYFKIVGWGWYFLSTIIDDYSRYIIHYELCSTMKSEDVMRNVDKAMQKAKLKRKHPPKLLSDNGSCYIAKDLSDYLQSNFEMKQIHGKPAHPQTQGKIERYHRSMKSVVKLQNYYCPEELETAIDEYVNFYNKERYHESLDNLTPEDVYLGRGEKILRERKRIKIKTLNRRRKEYEKQKYYSSFH